MWDAATVSVLNGPYVGSRQADYEFFYVWAFTYGPESRGRYPVFSAG
jgi:hypothetical protein